MLSICGNSFKAAGQAFQVKLVEMMTALHTLGIKAKGGGFEESSFPVAVLMRASFITALDVFCDCTSVYHRYLVTTQLIGSSALRRKEIPQMYILIRHTCYLKCIPGDYLMKLVERLPSCLQGKGWLF